MTHTPARQHKLTRLDKLPAELITDIWQEVARVQERVILLQFDAKTGNPDFHFAQQNIPTEFHDIIYHRLQQEAPADFIDVSLPKARPLFVNPNTDILVFDDNAFDAIVLEANLADLRWIDRMQHVAAHWSRLPVPYCASKQEIARSSRRSPYGQIVHMFPKLRTITMLLPTIDCLNIVEERIPSEPKGFVLRSIPSTFVLEHKSGKEWWAMHEYNANRSQPLLRRKIQVTGKFAKLEEV
ncbi:hypothetical protein B0H63DRAFT_529754 [Podospora didyma]|uniref:Uncharacterized protein n=1 Tax=Podospora didyma TaxID=330526 RepID=A0AAE0N136_9PEZI|nr:hypothetical protein B0H63DRAFT_529754 [Podospora didyma]